MLCAHEKHTESRSVLRASELQKELQDSVPQVGQHDRTEAAHRNVSHVRWARESRPK